MATATAKKDSQVKDDQVGAPTVTADTEDERIYVALIQPTGGVKADVDLGGLSTALEAWIELGSVTAPSKAEAWKEAKKRWPVLVPPTPASAEEANAQGAVRAKLVPMRYFGTIESRVEYVEPRAVATGI